MVWLAAQMWILLALSLGLGLLGGWWVWHRPPNKMDEEADKELARLRSRIEESEAEKNKLRSQLLEYESQSEQEPAEDNNGAVDPILYESASDGNPDDLKKIKGIGPQLEKLLNEMGIYYYHQIAAWTDNQAEKIDDKLRFKGRILRDNWRAQASALTAKR